MHSFRERQPEMYNFRVTFKNDGSAPTLLPNSRIQEMVLTVRAKDENEAEKLSLEWWMNFIPAELQIDNVC